MSAKPQIHLKVGEVYGSWTVKEVGLYSEKSVRKLRSVRVVCVCGTERVMAIYPLVYGHSRSCGCSLKTGVIGYVGDWITNLRANKKFVPRINVTARQVLKHLGPRPSKNHHLALTSARQDVRLRDIVWCLGRPDNVGRPIYCVSGEWVSLKYGAERLGLSFQAVRERLRLGWSVEDAFTVPKGGKR